MSPVPVPVPVPASCAAADALWACLAFGFFVAFCAHKVSSQLPAKYTTCRLFVLFQDLIRYGKTKHKRKRGKWLRVLDVPKRWFWHFYAVSVGWNTLLLVLHLDFRFQSRSYPRWLTGMLDVLTGVPRPDGGAPQLSTLLLLPLVCAHSLRRLLECVCVSVFSDGAMHLLHYVFGLAYYILLGLTALCSDRVAKGTGALLSQLDWFHAAGSALFLGASLLQHRSMVLLASLRIGKSGTVETLAHKMPVGGWFELVSCPHYFAELLIYVSFSLLLGGRSLTWWLLVLYVLMNQALAAQLCHELYISKYKSYPKHRKAFIPFVL